MDLKPGGTAECCANMAMSIKQVAYRLMATPGVPGFPAFGFKCRVTAFIADVLLLAMLSEVTAMDMA